MLQLPTLDRPIDNTIQSAYMTCPREFFFGYVLHRRAKETAVPLSFGSIWHKILEWHYKSGADFLLVEEKLAEYVAKNPMPVGTDYRTVARALMDYKQIYFKKWPLGTDIKSTLGFPDNPMVEITTSIQGGALAHPYAGKLDRLINDGMMLVEDHKTTSRFDKYYFDQYINSNQMMGYTYIANQLMPGEKFMGVRINLYHCLTKDTAFHRQVITYSQARLEEWANNYNSWCARIRMEYFAYLMKQGKTPDELGLDGALADFLKLAFSNPFPAHFGDNGCTRKFGRCTYFKVCELPPRIQAKALEQDFNVKPWNPLAMEEED